ncbi:hypothetical protein WS75_16270 [Burkholderia sp. FL-7-2-10-S1-D7]|nr:hypothetical protein WS75_16270 [Burkholderia sp. FL-7-2-10-S1-D7]
MRCDLHRKYHISSMKRTHQLDAFVMNGRARTLVKKPAPIMQSFPRRHCVGLGSSQRTTGGRTRANERRIMRMLAQRKVRNCDIADESTVEQSTCIVRQR